MKLRKSLILATAPLTLIACSESYYDQSIDKGVIVSKRNSSEPIYESEYSCGIEYNWDSGDYETECGWDEVYKGEEPTVTIRLAGCAVRGAEVTVATPEYIRNHLRYPTDFSMTHEGSVPSADPEFPIQCGVEVEVANHFGQMQNVGDYMTVESLESQRIG